MRPHFWSNQLGDVDSVSRGCTGGDRSRRQHSAGNDKAYTVRNLVSDSAATAATTSIHPRQRVGSRQQPDLAVVGVGQRNKPLDALQRGGGDRGTRRDGPRGSDGARLQRYLEGLPGRTYQRDLGLHLRHGKRHDRRARRGRRRGEGRQLGRRSCLQGARDRDDTDGPAALRGRFPQRSRRRLRRGFGNR